MLAVLEAKQSQSLSEVITLREALESSRLEGELLRQEQAEVTAALSRVRRRPPLQLWVGSLQSCVPTSTPALHVVTGSFFFAQLPSAAGFPHSQHNLCVGIIKS